MKTTYRTKEYVRVHTMNRHDKLRDLGLCINGPSPWTTRQTRPAVADHGPVVQAGRCQRCLDVKRRSH